MRQQVGMRRCELCGYAERMMRVPEPACKWLADGCRVFVASATCRACAGLQTEPVAGAM